MAQKAHIGKAKRRGPMPAACKKVARYKNEWLASKQVERSLYPVESYECSDCGGYHVRVKGLH